MGRDTPLFQQQMRRPAGWAGARIAGSLSVRGSIGRPAWVVPSAARRQRAVSWIQRTPERNPDGRQGEPESRAPAYPAAADMPPRNARRPAPGQAPQATCAAGPLPRRKSEISQQECYGLGGRFRPISDIRAPEFIARKQSLAPGLQPEGAEHLLQRGFILPIPALGRDKSRRVHRATARTKRHDRFFDLIRS